MSDAKKPGIGRWIALVVVIGLGIGGYMYWQESQHWESTDDAQIDARIHEISARVAGTVQAIKVEDNMFVEAGTVLAEIDPRPYQVAVDQAKAEIAQAEAEAAAVRSDLPVLSMTTSSQLSSAQGSLEEVNAAIATAQQQVTATRARLPIVEAQLRHAQADDVKAANDLKRYETLIAKEEISRQQYDGARGAAAATKAEVEATQATLAEIQHAIEVAEARVAQEKSRLSRAQSEIRQAGSGPQQIAATQARAQAAAAKTQTARARLQQAELNLEYVIVKAPVGGVVRRNVELGQSVQAGQPVIMIVPLNDIWVVANFKENQLAQIKVGQPAEIAVDAYGGKTHTGKVESISPATGARFSLLPPDNATGNFVKVVQRLTVKIVLDKGQDGENQLRPGMSVVPKVRVK